MLVLNLLFAFLQAAIFNPYGDPFPDRSGLLAIVSGAPLTAWVADQPGRIVHLEDDPPLAYAQILARGLHLG